MSRGTDPPDPIVTQLRSLFASGEATGGLEVRRSRGGLVLSRRRQAAASVSSELDPRLRLTPLGGKQFGLSLYRRNRWEPLPFQGTLPELVEVMNSALAPWAQRILYGLGVQMLKLNSRMNISGTFGVLIVLALLGVVLSATSRLVRHRYLFWAPLEQTDVNT